jgi:hypothetical protein
MMGGGKHSHNISIDPFALAPKIGLTKPVHEPTGMTTESASRG